MAGEGRISEGQAVTLLILTIVPTSILILPHMVYHRAKQDAWLSFILIGLFALISGQIYAWLAERFPGQNIIQLSREILGTLAGTALGLGYAIYFVYLNSFILREFGEMLTTNFYTETPQAVFAISSVAVIIYITQHGVEVLARVGQAVLPLLILMIFLLILFILPYIEFTNLLPVLDQGMRPVVLGSLPAAVFFTEIFVILMITPFLAKGSVRSIIYRSVIYTGMMQVVIVLALIAVMGTLNMNTLYPVLFLARQVLVGPYLYSVDPFILLLWISGGFLKMAVFNFCATISLAQVFGLKNYGLLAIVTGAATGSLSVALWDNAVELAYQISSILPLFFIGVQVGGPLLLLVMAVIRGKGEHPTHE